MPQIIPASFFVICEKDFFLTWLALGKRWVASFLPEPHLGLGYIVWPFKCRLGFRKVMLYSLRRRRSGPHLLQIGASDPNPSFLPLPSFLCSLPFLSWFWKGGGICCCCCCCRHLYQHNSPPRGVHCVLCLRTTCVHDPS